MEPVASVWIELFTEHFGPVDILFVRSVALKYKSNVTCVENQY